MGFYIYYHGDSNHYPQRAIILDEKGKIVKTIPNASEDLRTDRTIWCGHCLEAGIPCDFNLDGRGEPPCITNYDQWIEKLEEELDP